MIKVIMGANIDSSYAVRIEINGYEINLLNGKRDEYCTPYYGIEFAEDQDKEFIESMKELLFRLRYYESDYTNNQT
jgi:hypothetical protein